MKTETSKAALLAANQAQLGAGAKPTIADILGVAPVAEQVGGQHPARPPRKAPERFAFNIPEACESLGIGRTSIYEMAKRGEIKLLKIAGRTVVPRSELERLTRVHCEAA